MVKIAEGAGEPRVKRHLYAKRGRRTTVTIGSVQVTIIPTAYRGRKAWEIELPAGGEIDHVDVTNPVTLDLSTDNPHT